MKTGLVLEGGAMRGMFTAGILDVFMEEGIQFDGTIGVSAGAAFGVNYKSGQIGRAIRYNAKFCNDPRYCGLRSLLRDGNIYSRDFCYGEVPLVHDVFDFEAYSRNPMPFYLVATDVETGAPVYHQFLGKEDHGFDWIRASASMPLVSQMVEIEGRKLLDGGISDSIPLRYFEELGYDRNVVILTQPRVYEKKENGLLFMVRLLYRKYPKLVKAMEERHMVYNETLRYIEKKEAAGEILVLRPWSALPVGRVERNPEKLHRAYRIGREMALERLEEVRVFLSPKQESLSEFNCHGFKGMYFRENSNRDVEYWFEFMSCCIHRPVDGQYMFCNSVPVDAVAVDVGDESMNSCCFHSSFIGSGLTGIFSDGDGYEFLRFDNGNVINILTAFDPNPFADVITRVYADYLFYTADLLKSGESHWDEGDMRFICRAANCIKIKG